MPSISADQHPSSSIVFTDAKEQKKAEAHWSEAASPIDLCCKKRVNYFLRAERGMVVEFDQEEYECACDNTSTRSSISLYMNKAKIHTSRQIASTIRYTKR